MTKFLTAVFLFTVLASAAFARDPNLFTTFPESEESFVPFSRVRGFGEDVAGTICMDLPFQGKTCACDDQNEVFNPEKNECVTRDKFGGVITDANTDHRDARSSRPSQSKSNQVIK